MPDWLIVLLLLITGFILLLIELLIIPGFGFMGISGLVAMGAGIYTSYVKLTPFLSVLITLGSIIGIALLLKSFPKTKLWRKLKLETKEGKEQGFQASSQELEKFRGKTGYSITPLRPVGTALIEGTRLDVVTEGLFLEKNTSLKVVNVEGNKIVVEKTKEN